jgi:hypothetical protein
MVQVGCTINYARTGLWKARKKSYSEVPRVDYLRELSENT